MGNKEFYTQLAQQYVGHKFGRLIVQSVLPNRKKGRIVMRCLCSCSNEHNAILTNLKDGKIQSCGCLNREGDTHKQATLISAAVNFKNRSGEKYYRLTFLQPIRRGKRMAWTLQCECGKVITAYAAAVVSGKTKSCGCYNSEMTSIRARKRRKFSPQMSSARAVWRRCYDDCDFDLFCQLSQNNCFYCGGPPRKTTNVGKWKHKKKHYGNYQEQHGDFVWNGLDRLDSSKGHTPDNIVTCCYICNYMKNNLSVNDFLVHLKTILSHMENKDYSHRPR